MSWSAELRRELQKLAKDADAAPESDYKRGFFAALYAAEEEIDNLVFERGEDE